MAHWPPLTDHDATVHRDAAAAATASPALLARHFSPSPDRCVWAQIHWAISYRSGWISLVALTVTGVAAAL